MLYVHILFSQVFRRTDVQKGFLRITFNITTAYALLHLNREEWKSWNTPVTTFFSLLFDPLFYSFFYLVFLLSHTSVCCVKYKCTTQLLVQTSVEQSELIFPLGIGCHQKKLYPSFAPRYLILHPRSTHLGNFVLTRPTQWSLQNIDESKGHRYMHSPRSYPHILTTQYMVLYIRNLGFKRTPCLYRLTKAFCYLSLLNHFKIITKRTIQIVLFSYNTLPLIPPCLLGLSTVIMIIPSFKYKLLSLRISWK